MSLFAPNSHILCREINPPPHHNHHHQQQQQNLWGGGSCFVLQKSQGFSFWGRSKDEGKKEKLKRDLRVEAAFWPDLSKPAAMEMQPIEDCDHLDKILDEAKQLSQPVIIDWMASWCRKCIYLKPKLEKLAADYDTKVKFFCVDVNKVPQSLVKRGNINKMPTIQLWKDGEMKAEVIGGHKAWLVIEEVRQMIQNFV